MGAVLTIDGNGRLRWWAVTEFGTVVAPIVFDRVGITKDVGLGSWLVVSLVRY